MSLQNLREELQEVDVDTFMRSHIDASHRLNESPQEFGTLWEEAAIEFPFMRAFYEVQVRADRLHGSSEEDAKRHIASFMTFCAAMKEMIDSDELKRIAEG